MFKGHLPQHMRTHEQVFNFLLLENMKNYYKKFKIFQIKTHGCLTCGALFSQRSQLIVHQRIHSGVSIQNFKDLECFYLILILLESQERPYRCQVCLQAFAHSSVLKLHIRKVRFSCISYKEFFINLIIFTAHRRKAV